MEPAKSFNNVILGQFVLTGVPVKVYVGGRFLTITDADDVEDEEFEEVITFTFYQKVKDQNKGFTEKQWEEMGEAIVNQIFGVDDDEKN